MTSTQSVRVVEGDLTAAFESTAHRTGVLAIDCETTGLDWQTAQLATIQVAAAPSEVEVIKVSQLPPKALLVILEDPGIQKIFHHALFDLRFIAASWDCRPANVACTKVAAKVLQAARPDTETSLKPLVRRYLNIELDKTLQTSDWTGALTEEQLGYAANDVVHLSSLLEALRDQLRREALDDLVDRCFDHIPTRLRLDLLRLSDVFSY